jgi:macrodomain Ter protein organizer (MatP/YcbG family)
MAIRLEHQPVGISGLAAYAAGAGRKRERDLKYGVQLAQQGQGRRDKYNLQANQQQFRIGELNLANQFAKAKEARGVLQKKADWDKEVAEQNRVRGLRLAEEAKVKAEEIEYEQFMHEQTRARLRHEGLTPIPKGIPKAKLIALEALEKEMGELSDAMRWDTREPEARAEFDRAFNEYNRILGTIREKSVQEKFDESRVTGDDGSRYYIDRHGEPKLLPKTEQTITYRGNKMTRSEYNEERKASIEFYNQWKELKAVADDETTFRDPPEILPPLLVALNEEKQALEQQALQQQQTGPGPRGRPQQSPWELHERGQQGQAAEQDPAPSDGSQGVVVPPPVEADAAPLDEGSEALTPREWVKQTWENYKAQTDARKAEGVAPNASGEPRGGQQTFDAQSTPPTDFDFSDFSEPAQDSQQPDNLEPLEGRLNELMKKGAANLTENEKIQYRMLMDRYRYFKAKEAKEMGMQ